MFGQSLKKLKEISFLQWYRPSEEDIGPCISFVIWYATFNFYTISLYFIERSYNINGNNSLRTAVCVSHLISGGVLGLEIFLRMQWNYGLMKKLHYIPTFLLCELSNILFIIFLLKNSRFDVRELNPVTLQLMIVVGSVVALITFHCCLDGLYIYHHRRNEEHQLRQHIGLLVICILALHLLSTASTIYLCSFSKYIELHLTSGVFIFFSNHISFVELVNAAKRTDKKQNRKTVKVAVRCYWYSTYFGLIAILGLGLLQIVTVGVGKVFDPNQKKHSDLTIFSNILSIFPLILGRVTCLSDRIFPDNDTKEESKDEQMESF